MEKIAFVMQLKPGFEQEYQKRHDDIWPELEKELRDAGVSDYSIFLHPETLQLFGVLKREDNHRMDDLPQTQIMQKWWRHMADIMDTHADNSPVTAPLNKVFHLE
ncbi:L-rhamnose mutarotase [Gilvimarinus xylanilyticus]|uniref:L-rhamnose mutarotase n=1 Tax=Gilvimarinus xylanilyticus TaxID=2944139 RepID=A0A9X2I3I2_9GAMM|nr:L-rhamnose mutarotase [Gilvimarinus xylanilyticus]MCP8898277.1 L-rhamnose mutarotase [Gilvimarinus xylanilyticus]